jgi:diguanylate cyclase (GGDEF)-like protein
MTLSRLTVLIVEDDEDDALLVRELLLYAQYDTFTVVVADRLANALEQLAARRFDLILLDLSLPDSHGLDTLSQVRLQTADIPIIVFTGHDDDLIGVQAVKAGAQDYMVKGEVTRRVLVRAIRYAIERNRMQLALRDASWVDDLTGLYNRRGFMALAAQHYKLVQRMKKGLLLLYVDLDGLKSINDRHGHLAGDDLLRTAASMLQKTFRSSDVVARIGGDEFAVLVLGGTAQTAGLLARRLAENVEQYNQQVESVCKLALSTGTVEIDESATLAIDEWLAAADQAMYRDKQRKHTA